MKSFAYPGLVSVTPLRKLVRFELKSGGPGPRGLRSMDYELYDNSNILLNGENPNNSKNSWNIPSDGSMDNNDEYFDWNPLKIDEDHVEHGQVSNTRQSRKRKLPTIEASPSKIKQTTAYKSVQDPLAVDEKQNQKKASVQSGRCKTCVVCLTFLLRFINTVV